MFFDLLEYPFFQKALLVGILIAILAPLIGIFLVVRRYSNFAEASSHIGLLGIAVGVLWQIYPTLGGLVFTVFLGIILEVIRTHTKIYSESLITIFISLALACLSIILSLNRQINFNLNNYFFGSLLAINSTDLWLIIAIFLVVTTIILSNFNRLFNLVYGEQFAKLNLRRPWVYNYLLIICISLVVGVSIQLLGGLLVSSLMIIPVVASLQLNLNFKVSTIIAIIIAVICTINGLILSFYLSLPSGATITLFAVGFLVLTTGLNKLRLV